MTETPKLLDRFEHNAAQLMREHPPVLRDTNKQTVFDVCCPLGAAHAGVVRYSRWESAELPARVDLTASSAGIEACPDVYDYARALEGAVEWHVNFADPELFFAYSGPLFAQDEMQVAEHPALGALVEALHAEGLATRTQGGSCRNGTDRAPDGE